MNIKFEYNNEWYLRYYYNIFAAQAKFFFNYVFQQSGSKKDTEKKDQINKVPISQIRDNIIQEYEILRVNRDPVIDMSNVKKIKNIKEKFDEINQKFPSGKEYDATTLGDIKVNMYDYIDQRNRFAQSIDINQNKYTTNQKVQKDNYSAIFNKWENTETNFAFSK